MAKYVIFDLDHTVIDSSHRQLTKADGSLDLSHWRENCTAEKIFADKLLPLAATMRRVYASGYTVIVCTARVMTEHDFAFLAKHDLSYHHIIHRAPDDMRGDADYKVARLNELARSLGFVSVGGMSAVCFDDNLKVIEALTAARVCCVNAINENRRLAA